MNKSIIFYYPDNDTQEWVEIQYLDEKHKYEIYDSLGIKRKLPYIFDVSSNTINRFSGIQVTSEQNDTLNETIWDFSIVDWKLFSIQGEEISCTKENKIKLMRESPKFAIWIGSCLSKIIEVEEVKKREINNNLIEYAQALSDKPSCEACRHLKTFYEQIVPCDIDGACAYIPELSPENAESIFVWSMTQDQLRTAGMDGTPFAPDHNAIWTLMDKFDISNQTEVFQKVLILFNYFLNKMREERQNG